MINASEKYIIGVDITETEIPVLTIARENGKNLQYVQSITGDDALHLYETISKGAIKKRVVMKDNGKAHCPRCIHDVHGLGRIQFCYNCGQGLIWPNDGGALNIRPYDKSRYEPTHDTMSGLDIDGDKYLNLKGGNKND
jgi:hypothetical protein